MKTLVVYFTRTQTTKKAAEMLAEKLSADLEEIKDQADWSGVVGYLRAARAAMKNKTTEISDSKFDPAAYDLVVVGTPVWVGCVTPAIRAYLQKNKELIRQIAFFTTQGSAQRQRALDDLRNLAGREPAAELWLKTAVVVKGDPSAEINAFYEKIRQAN
ncbi:MAG: flavodoxin [Planctomycetes bacterium]|jgi:flavodoxin|nr:flavodoxin [Planctomycetota bacterium]